MSAEARLPPRALLLSSLRASSPLVLLNVSLGDQAFVERRHCGCPLESMGWDLHLHTIRSFEKLTAGGMTFLGSDVIRVMEDVLPGRFGGGPADYQLVALLGKRLQYGQLGGDLGAADDRHERPRRSCERLAQCVELGCHERPCARDACEARHAVRGRLGAVRRAERIVDVDVAERGDFFCQHLVVLLLADVEAAVLEHHHLAGVGSQAELSGRLFGMKEGDVTPAMRVSTGWLFATVTGRQDAYIPQLAEVKDKVTEDVKHTGA